MVCGRMECRGTTVTKANSTDLQWVVDVQEGMEGKAAPVILKASNSTVGSEFEPSADAILVSFGVQD